MRILLDPGVYDMRNKGNVAMLQAATSRFRQLWPDAVIGVITVSPNVLDYYCPETQPVSIDDKPDWSGFSTRFDGVQQFLPRLVQKSLFELREETWRRWPALKTRLKAQTWFDARSRNLATENLSGEDAKVEGVSPTSLKKSRGVSVQGADLLVATGGGIMCDIAEEHAISVFDRLETALELGKPAVMVGQGIGPMTDAKLTARARAIFPHVDFIAIREKRGALPLLDSFGVDLSRVMTTGDDAVEMTYAQRSEKMGHEIGLNLRLMSYTGVNVEHIQIMRKVIHKAARRYKTKLVSLPISYDLREKDAEATRLLMRGYPKLDDVSWRKFDPPLALIQRAKQCRIVITGAYHTAVFALAQGIPAICIAKSDAYWEKLLGLADQFNPGCQVIGLGDERLEQKLTEAIENTWKEADELRPELLKSAEAQIVKGHAAYKRIFELYRTKTGTIDPLRDYL